MAIEKKDIRTLKENEVIACPTIEDAIALDGLLEANGIDMTFKAQNRWKQYHTNSYFRPTGKIFGSIPLAKEKLYTIYQLSDFIGITKCYELWT